MLKLFLKKSYIYLLGNHDDLSFGECFHYGHYTFKKDLKLARRYYLAASKKGKEIEAYYHLSRLAEEERNICEFFYYEGMRAECAKDYQSALACYEEINNKNAVVKWIISMESLTQRNYAPAMYRAALLLKQDHLSTPEQSVKKDLAAALIWYRKAVIGGSKEALDELILFSEKQAKAALYLAQMYEKGEIGNEKSLSLALTYYKKSSKLSDPIASCRLQQLEDAKDSNTQQHPKFQKKYAEAYSIIYEELGEFPKFYEITGCQIFFEALGRAPSADERLGFGIFRNELGTTPTSNEILGFDTLHKALGRIPTFDEVIGFDILYKQFARIPTADEILGFKTQAAPSQSAETPTQSAEIPKTPKNKTNLKAQAEPMAHKEEPTVSNAPKASTHSKQTKERNCANDQKNPESPKNTTPKLNNAIPSVKKEKSDTENKTHPFSFYKETMDKKPAEKNAAFHLGLPYQDEDKEKAFDCFVKAAKNGCSEALITLERLAHEMNPEKQLQLFNLYRSAPLNDQNKALYWCQQAMQASHLQDLTLSTANIKQLFAVKQALNLQQLSQILQSSTQQESKGLFGLFT